MIKVKISSSGYSSLSSLYSFIKKFIKKKMWIILRKKLDLLLAIFVILIHHFKNYSKMRKCRISRKGRDYFWIYNKINSVLF